jgi:capsular polysaccharide transport system permease protein
MNLEDSAERDVARPKSYTSTTHALREKGNVMKAVMLRDMRTRFFDHGLGFLIVSIWPLVHILVLLLVSRIAGRTAPFGDSASVFYATGIIPTIAFMYVSRFMSLSVILNKPMLVFPAVTVIDIMAARAYLEIIAAFLTLVFVFTYLWLTGEDPFPYKPEQAVLCYLSTLLLAIGVGSIAGVITTFLPFFATVYALMMILVYMSSGALFVTSAMPDVIAIPLSYSPIVQCVEWMRTSYFETYSDRLIDKEYVVYFGMSSLFVGLLLERVLRRKVMES